jgi:hypothetical protein
MQAMYGGRGSCGRGWMMVALGLAVGLLPGSARASAPDGNHLVLMGGAFAARSVNHTYHGVSAGAPVILRLERWGLLAEAGVSLGSWVPGVSSGVYWAELGLKGPVELSVKSEWNVVAARNGPHYDYTAALVGVGVAFAGVHLAGRVGTNFGGTMPDWDWHYSLAGGKGLLAELMAQYELPLGVVGRLTYEEHALRASNGTHGHVRLGMLSFGYDFWHHSR